MKKRIMLFLFCFSFLFLVGCGSNNTGSSRNEIPSDALYPVWADEKKGLKSTEIPLADFTFSIPEGYVYCKSEQDTYNAYYIWQDKPGKEYIVEGDTDIMLYIYEGLDSSSLHSELKDSQARSSFKSAYMMHLRTLTSASLMYDGDMTLSSDDKYYVYCFEGTSGDYISTTYSSMCYPKSYYGIYTLQKETDTYDRRWYGFTFSNDNEGEIFTQSEYEYLLAEIKSLFNINEFYTLQKKGSFSYDPLTDYSNGKSFEQMENLFANTYLYYVDKLGKPTERENTDAPVISRYEIIANTEELTWIEASEKAASMFNEETQSYGYLSHITSYDEWEQVKGLLDSDTHYWIGGYRNKGADSWFWAGGPSKESTVPFYKSNSLNPAADGNYGGSLLWGFGGWETTGDGIEKPAGNENDLYIEVTTNGWNNVSNNAEDEKGAAPYDISISHYIVEWTKDSTEAEETK